MKSDNRDSLLVAAVGPDALKGFTDALNTEFFPFLVPTQNGWQRVVKDYRPVQRKLHRLVQAWFDSGPNVQKLLESDSALAKTARNFRAQLIPFQGGRARLIYDAAPEEVSSHATALGLFFDFLLNPHNHNLGGPCKQCGRYYVKNTKRQTVYCSKRCGLKYTSRAAIHDGRAREHLAKLKEAKRLSEMWAKTRTPKGWKEWVSGHTPLITKHWLTRAVKNGKLIEPKKWNSAIDAPNEKR